MAVLMGGTSSEREVSLSTGRQIAGALDPSKYTSVMLDTAGIANPRSEAPEPGSIEPLNLAPFGDPASPNRPDVAFLALHGRGGEDGSIQGLLDLLGIPYTGSGVLASALAMDKAMAKVVLRAAGIPVPGGLVLDQAVVDARSAAARVLADVDLPCVVKPSREGSTIGCHIVRTEEELAPAIADAYKHDRWVLAEEFIEGTEITVGLLGNDEPEVLPTIEIIAEGGFYDYTAKYASGGSRHIIPARISPRAEELARKYARETHRALGCRGVSRVDMIVRGDEPVVLEANTIPGMTPTSLLPDAASHAGIPFSELLDRMIRLAMEC